MSTCTTSTVSFQYISSILDNIQDGVALLGIEPNNSYRFLLCNKAFLNNPGCPKDCVGKTVANVTLPKDYPAFVKRYKQVMTSKDAYECVEWFDVSLGRQAYEVKLLPILNAVGDCVQILSITRNVTELYKLRDTAAAAQNVE